ncbi:MAG TPA: YcxB family protein [Lachnospiraceae bacterium]|nr:YcxB family protein [Lachnospiraceae bacterium]
MIEFDVHMNSGDLYDYMLKNTYNSFSGLFGSLVGALMIVAGIYVKRPFMLTAGVILLIYLPWTLFIKSKQQALNSPAFKEPLHYVLDDEGIHVSQKDTVKIQKWDDIVKAVSTGRSLIVYTSPMNAFIFPKRDLGDYTSQVIQVISTHLPAKKVKIKQ